MNILRRRVPAAEAAGKNGPAEPTVNRRIMVTVERETVTMQVRGRAKTEVESPPGEAPAVEEHAAEAERRKLLPPPGGK